MDEHFVYLKALGNKLLQNTPRAGMEGVNPSLFTDWGLQWTIYKMGLNGMWTDCSDCFCPAGGYHTGCFFFTMGMLGVARGVCDLIDFQGKFGKSCECCRLNKNRTNESHHLANLNFLHLNSVQ